MLIGLAQVHLTHTTTIVQLSTNNLLNVHTIYNYNIIYNL